MKQQDSPDDWPGVDHDEDQPKPAPITSRTATTRRAEQPEQQEPASAAASPQPEVVWGEQHGGWGMVDLRNPPASLRKALVELLDPRLRQDLAAGVTLNLDIPVTKDWLSDAA